MGATPSSHEKEILDMDYAEEVRDANGEMVWRCKEAVTNGGLIGRDGDGSVKSLYDSFAAAHNKFPK